MWLIGCFRWLDYHLFKQQTTDDTFIQSYLILPAIISFFIVMNTHAFKVVSGSKANLSNSLLLVDFRNITTGYSPEPTSFDAPNHIGLSASWLRCNSSKSENAHWSGVRFSILFIALSVRCTWSMQCLSADE